MGIFPRNTLRCLRATVLAHPVLVARKQRSVLRGLLSKMIVLLRCAPNTPIARD